MRKNKCIYCLCAAFIISLNAAVAVSAATQNDLREQLKSETAVLIDANTGQVLFEKDMSKKMYPASITKIMSALLALERGDLDDTITMSYDAVFSVGRDTSHISLDVDEELTLEQAMYALALESANDAANGIAEYIGGTLEDFAILMNRKAKEVGAWNTNFTNAHGLPDENHYTTAYDMARITMAALALPELMRIFTAEKYDMSPTNLQPEERYFWCRNAMMVGNYKYDGIIIEKTGWTHESEHTLVTAAKRGNRTLIAVVLKSSNPNDKWKDATALLDYGFNEFKSVSFSPEELSKENYSITYADGNNKDVNLSSTANFNCLILKSLTKDDIDIKYVTEKGNSDDLQVRAVFFLKPAVSSIMFAELGNVEIRVQTNDNLLPINADPLPEEIEQAENKTWEWFSTLTRPLIIIAFIAVVLLLFHIRRYYINKRRRRSLRYGRYKYYG